MTTFGSLMLDERDAIGYLETLGRAGFIVSICCGPCGAQPFAWSINVMNRAGEEFARPEGALSFTHAVAIALVEIERRQWM